MTVENHTSPERAAVALVIVALAAPLLVVIGSVFGVPLIVSAVVALALAGAACPLVASRLPREWDGLRRTRTALCVLWLLLGLAAVARTAGVALFMADAEQAQASAYWFDEFYVRHNCFSGFWKAAELARGGAVNLYDPVHYYGMEGRFKLDEFLYMPQFLILPGAGVVLGGDFAQLRAAWFALEAGLVAMTMLALCTWIGGPVGRRAGLLIPAVWLATPTLLTLQLGNFQLAAIAMTVLAMMLFERDRPALGGALFGFAVFKIFPGLLGVYLLFAKRWRAAVWTFAFAALYSAIAYAWLGSAPFEAFLNYQLPRIVNGEAWAFLDNEGLGAVVAINDSVPGLVQKLKLLGVPGMSRSLQGTVAWVWALIVVGLAVLAARRAPAQSRVERTCTWIALLALASFRSPFLPDHSGLFAPLWLWSLVAAAAIPTGRHIVLLAFAGIALAAVLPFGGMPLPGEIGRLALSSASQLIAIGLCLWVVLRRPSQHAFAMRAAASRLNEGVTTIDRAAAPTLNPDSLLSKAAL